MKKSRTNDPKPERTLFRKPGKFVWQLFVLLSFPCFSAQAQIDLQTHGTATQSSDWNTAGTFDASKGIDGNTSTFTHTKDWNGSWWQLELDQVFTVERIEIVNRNNWEERMDGLNLRVYDGSDQLVHQTVLTNPGASETLGENLPDGTQAKRIWVGLDPGQVNGEGDSIVTVAEVTLYENFTPPPTDPPPAQVITEPATVTQFEDAIALYLHGFDVARSQYPSLELKYHMILADGTVGTGRILDLTGEWEKPSILIRKDSTEYAGIVVSATSGDNVFFRRYYPLSGTVNAPTLVLTTTENAAIELGQFTPTAPVIPFPDRSQFDAIEIGAASYGTNLDGAGLQVTSEINYPQVSSEQLCALSRQTDFPNDATKRSLYIPLKSQLFDQATGQPNRVSHYLCEIPLDPNWLNGSDDLIVSLHTNQIKVHFTDLVAGNGVPITGDGGGGLGQGTGTMSVDADGNIYFSNSVPTHVVRFNISTASWEAPPADIVTLSNNFLPTDDEILGNGSSNENGRWQGYRTVASMNHSNPSRMLHGRMISKLSSNGTLYEWSGLFALPTDWSNPTTFISDFKLLVGSWPTVQHSFYDDLPTIGGPLRRIQWFKSYGNTTYAQPYPQSIGGPWRIDVAADNTVEAFGTPSTMPDYSDATNGPVDALPYNANRRIDYSGYGLLTMDRKDLHFCLHGVENNSLTGHIEVSYDAIAYMLENAAEFQLLLNNMGGPSLAPSYLAKHIPNRPGKALSVGQYGYFLAELDLSEAIPGEITKEFLHVDSPDPTLELPLKLGLGPYGHQWTKINGDDWLYISGYIGLTRMKYSDNGAPLGRYTMQPFDTDLTHTYLDAASGGPIKRWRWLQHGLDNRMFLTGIHTAERGGTAFSGGLLAFDKNDIDTLWRLSYMSRSYWTVRMRNRILRDTDGVPVQEFCAKSVFDEQYALTIPAHQVPVNRDPKIFVWDYKSGGQMRDLMGFSVPPFNGTHSVADTAYSNDRRYLILLQDNQLVTFDPQSNRFVDGKTLNYGDDMRVASFERPDYTFLRAPDDSLFLFLRPSASSSNSLFLKVRVSPEGALSVEPYFELHASSATDIDGTFGVQRAFLPDYANGDGSCDLLLGSRVAHAGGGTVCRLIKDFIPPRMHDLDRTLNLISSGVGGVAIAGTKPGTTPFSATCADGENVNLTAASTSSGFDFVEWQDEAGNTLGTATNLQLVIGEDRIVTAVYAEESVFTTIDPTTKTIDHNGQNYMISVTSNTTWSVTSLPSWVSANPTSGTGNGTITMTAQANNATTPRNDSISIGGQAHSITQQGIPALGAVDGVSASDRSDSEKVTISWLPENLAEGYRVMRAGTDDFSQATEVAQLAGSATQYDDTTATPGEAYHYWVLAWRAIDGVGPHGTSAQGERGEIFRSDLLIGKSLARLIGNDYYTVTGAGQTIKIRKKRSGKCFLRAQNDGNVAEQLRLLGRRSNRKFRFKYFQLTGGRTNVTSAMGRGAYHTPTLEPGAHTDFQIKASLRRPSGPGRKQALPLQAFSTQGPDVRDLGKALLRIASRR